MFQNSSETVGRRSVALCTAQHTHRAAKTLKTADRCNVLLGNKQSVPQAPDAALHPCPPVENMSKNVGLAAWGCGGEAMFGCQVCGFTPARR